jgi:hypothetical protein
MGISSIKLTICVARERLRHVLRHLHGNFSHFSDHAVFGSASTAAACAPLGSGLDILCLGDTDTHSAVGLGEDHACDGSTRTPSGPLACNKCQPLKWVQAASRRSKHERRPKCAKAM